MKGEPRSVLQGAGIALGTATTHIVMTFWMHAPIVQPDELGYLDNARYLANGGLRPITGYYPGLSALVAFFWKFTTDPSAVWRSTLWLNSILAGLTTFFVWMLLPRLSQMPLSTGRRVLITLVVSAYPALILYSNTSMAESLFQCAMAGVILLACWAFESMSSNRMRRNPVPWMALGLGVGLLPAVHPRGLAVVVAVVILALVALQPWSSSPSRSRPAMWMRLVALVGGLVIGLALTRIGLVLVRPAAGTSLGNYRADQVFGKVVAGGAPRLLATGIAGQFLYLTVATAGLAPLGAVLGLADLVHLLRKQVRFSAATAARAFTALSALGVFGMSVLFLNGGDRADQLIYGRYNEGCVAALLIIAITWVLEGSWRRVGLWAGVAAGGLVVGGAGLAVGMTPALRTAVVNVETVLTIESILRISGPYLNVAAIVASGVCFVGGACLIALRFPRIATALVGVAFVVAAVFTYTGFVARGSKARGRQDVLADTILLATKELHIAPSCIGWDAGLDFSFFQDKFLLSGWRIERYFGEQGQQPCGPFAISNRPDFFAHYTGSQIVSLENDLSMILYVLPGPALTTLQNAGWLLPANIPGPLPLSRQMATIIASVPSSMHVGGTASASVTAANVSARGNPWPNERGLRQGPFTVRVTARWFRPDQTPVGPGGAGDPPLASSVVEIPRTVLPGQQFHVKVPLVPRGPNGQALPAGQYVVLFAVYQEFVGTFPGGTATVQVVLQ